MIVKRSRLALALLGAVVLFGATMTPGVSNAGIVEGVKTASGLMMYLGVVPAATVSGHAKSHPEANMHSGVPSGSHDMHIVVAVFDKASGERIADAPVKAYISETGGLQRTVRLEPMTVAGALTYGGFTSSLRGIRYQTGIEVARPLHMQGSGSPIIPPRIHRSPAETAHFT